MKDVACYMIEMTDTEVETEYGTSRLWKRVDTGELKRKHEFPVGAMWVCDPEPDDNTYYRAGPDGKTLFVKTPGGDWNIDSRASNCGSPEDNEHRCWCRHGIPPIITVDKIGNTCVADAGSIAIADYHGFLINGRLTSCPD